jgi:hypothetical protein
MPWSNMRRKLTLPVGPRVPITTALRHEYPLGHRSCGRRTSAPRRRDCGCGRSEDHRPVPRRDSILVSHDEHLIELIADRLWLVADGTCSRSMGTLRNTGARNSNAAKQRGRKNQTAAMADMRSGGLPPNRRRELEPLRRQVRRAEEEVARLTRERGALDRALATAKGNGS